MATSLVKRRKSCAVVKKLTTRIVVKCFLRILWEFCSFTSLHGVRNLVSDVQHLNKSSTKKRFSRNQRVLATTMSAVTWAGAFVVGTAFALIMIRLIWQRFQTTPTTITVETYYYPIWNVPFPSVTICNLNKVYRPATKNIERKLLDYGVNGSDIAYFFSKLSGLVQPPPQPPNDVLLNVFDIVEKMGYTPETLMRELMQPCNQMFIFCEWLSKRHPCEELFQVTKGSNGFCCSFNYNATNDAKRKKKHYRVSGAGEFVGLSAIISPEAEHYVSYTRSFYGFSLIIQNTRDFIDMPSSFMLGQPGYFVTAMVTPSVLASDEAVRSLALKQRKCLFPDERNSELQDHYRLSSCLTECRLRGILQRCGCIPFYYPHTNSSTFSKYRQCSIRDFQCVRNIRNVISSLRPPNGTIGFPVQNDTGLDCECFPECYRRTYDTQFTLTDIGRSRTTGGNNGLNFTNNEMKNYTAIFVSFKSPVCIKYRRSLYMTWDGLFASFGGIFGLCLGGSVISLVELVYFTIVRVFGRMLIINSTKSPTPPNPIKTKKESSIYSHILSNRLPSKQSNEFLN